MTRPSLARVLLAIACSCALAAGEPARPASAAWLQDVARAETERLERTLPAAVARADELARIERERRAPSRLLLTLSIAGLLAPFAALAAAWLRWRPRRRMNCRGLVVDVAPPRSRTSTVSLLRPDRVAVAPARDRRREAEVRAAAEALAAEAEGDPSTNGTTRRIADKHATRQHLRRLSERRRRVRRAPLGLLRTRGMTLVEVIIAVAILAVALVTLLGGLGTLDRAHQGNRELAAAQTLAQAVAERIQGARWSAFGEPAAGTETLILRHRRDPDTPRDTKIDAALPDPAPVHPPMTDAAPSDADDLRELGLLREGSSVRGLRVYVSYAGVANVPGADGRLAERPARTDLDRPEQWRLVDEPAFRLPEADADLRAALLSPVDQHGSPLEPISALVATITVRWDRLETDPAITTDDAIHRLTIVRRR